MKLAIEKKGDTVRVELTTDTGKKPIVLNLEPHQLDLIVQMLGTAGQATTFKFSLEL